MSEFLLDECKKWLDYEPKTGILRWKTAKSKINIGNVAGSINKGYLRIKLSGKSYYAHRLAWLMFYGNLPDEIDHIDGDKTNNKIKNLRIATRKQNCLNRKIQSNNSSGLKGVNWNTDTNSWRVRISDNGKRLDFGLYKSIFEAACVIHSARNRFHGEFANHG